MTNSSSFQVHKEICNALCKNKDPSQGLSRWPSGKECAYQYRRYGFSPWVRKIPWSRKWQPAPVFLPEKFHGQRGLAGYSPWGCKESDTTEHRRTFLKHIQHIQTKHNNLKSIRWCLQAWWALDSSVNWGIPFCWFKNYIIIYENCPV